MGCVSGVGLFNVRWVCGNASDTLAGLPWSRTSGHAEASRRQSVHITADLVSSRSLSDLIVLLALFLDSFF